MRWTDATRDQARGNGDSAARVDREIEDEFAFHIAGLEDELRVQGHSEEAARTEARRRFGDETRLRKQCRFIATKERIMLQKINVAVTIVLLGAVALMGVLLYNAQRNNAMDRELLMTQVEALQSRFNEAATPPAVEQPKNTFRAGGLVKQPGNYVVPQGQTLTLARALTMAGGPRLDIPTLEVWHNTLGEPMRSTMFADLQRDPSLDVEVRAGDVVAIVVKSSPDGEQHTPTGTVYLSGAVERAGVYNLPVYGQLSIARLLKASGMEFDRTDLRVTVSRKLMEGAAGQIVLDVPIHELAGGAHENFLLEGNDLVTVAVREH